MRKRTDAKYPFLSMSLIDTEVFKARERIREKWEERQRKWKTEIERVRKEKVVQRVRSAKEKAIPKGKYNEDINSPRANFETSNYCQAAPRQIGL